MKTARDLAVEGTQSPATLRFDARAIREDFPILRQKIHGKPLVYLDNAATAQKPQVVIDAVQQFYCMNNSNIHRGVHILSQRATEAYEATRLKVRHFLNASKESEIIFVRSTTEAINLVVHSYGRKHLRAGDEVIISAMEHHSNIVPWQMLCLEKNVILRVAPMNDNGELLVEEYEKLFNPRTRFVSMVHLSNALGTLNPAREIVRIAHSRSVPVLIDGAQAAAHMKVDVQELGCDFYAFSGHKIYGPTGIGILYGKAEQLEMMPPYQGGGDMISSVTFEETIYNSVPYKFEAGTPNVAGGIGLGAAIDYLNEVGLDRVERYEHELLVYATDVLSDIPGLKIIGRAKKKASVLSFVLEGVHPHDIGTVLDQQGIAIRTGHHCAQPVMDRFGVPATARASVALYNTRAEIDALVKGIYRVIEVFN